MEFNSQLHTSKTGHLAEHLLGIKMTRQPVFPKLTDVVRVMREVEFLDQHMGPSLEAGYSVIRRLSIPPDIDCLSLYLSLSHLKVTYENIDHFLIKDSLLIGERSLGTAARRLKIWSTFSLSPEEYIINAIGVVDSEKKPTAILFVSDGTPPPGGRKQELAKPSNRLVLTPGLSV